MRKFTSISLTIPLWTVAAKNPNRVWFLFSENYPSHVRVRRANRPFVRRSSCSEDYPSQGARKSCTNMWHLYLPGNSCDSKQRYFFGRLRNQKSKAFKFFTRDRRPHQSNRKSLTFLFAWFVIPRTISQICPHAIEANVNRFLRIFQTIILFVLTRDALFPLFDVVFMKGFLESHKHQCVSNLGILTLFKWPRPVDGHFFQLGASITFPYDVTIAGLRTEGWVTGTDDILTIEAPGIGTIRVTKL